MFIPQFGNMSSWTPREIQTKIKITKGLKVVGLDSLKYNIPLISSDWRSTKKGIFSLFKRMNFREHMKVGNDLHLGFHLNKQYNNSYNSEKNRIEFNLLTYMFHLNLDDFKLFFKGKFWVGFYLIHEIDHYLYCVENDGIGLSEGESDAWDDKHAQSLETRAFNMQLQYLEEARVVLPSTIYLVQYFPDGRTGKAPNSRDVFLEKFYESTKTHLEEVKKGRDNYLKYAVSIAGDSSLKLGNKLGVKIDQSENEDYARVSINF